MSTPSAASPSSPSPAPSDPPPSSPDADGGGATVSDDIPQPTGWEGMTGPVKRAEAPPPVNIPAEDEPKRGRGRPKGSKNKSPGEDGPSITLAPENVAAKTENKNPTAELRKLFVDSKRAASTITIAMDGALNALAVQRYGKEMSDAYAATEAEKKELAAAWEAFLAATGTQLSPGAALALAIGGVYGVRGISMEMSLRQARASA